MARDRSAKELGMRYKLPSINQSVKFNPKRLALYIGPAVAASLILIGMAFSSSKKKSAAYSAGPLSSAHAFLANRCESCHSVNTGFKHRVEDSLCRTCHGRNEGDQGNQLPDHQVNQVASKVPTCASCHIEHRGFIRPVQVPDTPCMTCHGDEKLETNPKVPSEHPTQPWHRHPFERVTGFSDGTHPKFSAEPGEFKNPTTITFSHAKHLYLKKDDHDRPVNLQCSDCHRPVAESGSRWKYSYLEMAAAPSDSKVLPEQTLYPDNGRMLMTMPKYEQSCATSACHDLDFAKNIERLPHPKSKQDVPNLPILLKSSIEKYFKLPSSKRLELCSKGPLKLCAEDPDPDKIQLVEQPKEPAPRSDRERAFSDAAKFVWNVRCILCHQSDSSSIPETNPVEFPTWKETDLKKSDLVQRFMPYAVFSHQAHSPVQCESCHVLPPEPPCCNLSKPDLAQSHDIHMPGIETCAKCHSGNPPQAGQAGNGCFLCHQYHPWNPSRQMFRSEQTIRELTGWTPPQPKQ